MSVQCGPESLGCDGAADGMLQCQKVSDFLIAASYLSIPLELLYFASCAELAPLKWLLLQLAAFAVLGGAIHLLAVLSGHYPHSSRLLLASTAAKALAALVSFSTAVSLPTVIPRLIRAKARQLDRDLGLVRRRLDATSRAARRARHAPPRRRARAPRLRRLGARRRRAPPRAPDQPQGRPPRRAGRAGVHRRRRPRRARGRGQRGRRRARGGVGARGGGGNQPPGAVAAVRMPMLNLSDFDGGRTPEASSYAILVLVPFPSNKDDSISSSTTPTGWSTQDLETVQVVADQVAVALSHAAVLEDWKSTQGKLAEQHRFLLQAKEEATMATQAVSCIQSAMYGVMWTPMHSIVGLISILRQADGMRPEQRLVVDAMARASTLSSTLMNDVGMENNQDDDSNLSLVTTPFALHSLIRDAISIARCLSGCRGVGFFYQVQKSLPEWVVGDETRVLHLLLHMVDTLLRSRCKCCNGAGRRLSLSIESYTESNCSIYIEFQVVMESSESCRQFPHGPPSSETARLSFSVCKKVVQMMNGNMWSASDCEGHGESITLILQVQLPQSGVCRRTPPHIPDFTGLRILLADGDDMSLAVTKKLLEKLFCQVTSASSGIRCLALLGCPETSNFQLILLDLDMRREASMDGFEVAVQIRELRRSCWLPIVVALAVRIDDGVRDMCQQMGISGLIQKPITLTAMGDQLYRVLYQNNC